MKKKAFTLAETLITLGIIGVVAAITIPGLLQRAEEKVVVNKVLQVYSILTNTYNALLDEYGSPNTWEGISENNLRQANSLAIANHFAKKSKLNNICFTSKPQCHLYKGKTKYDALVSGALGSAYTVLDDVAGNLNDMTLVFSNMSASCNGWADFSWDSVTKNPNSPYYHACGVIHVDINGISKPNVYGRDLFEFIYTDTKIVPLGTPPTPYYSLRTSCNGALKKSWDGSINGNFCAAWVIKKKNMNYRKREVKW